MASENTLQPGLECREPTETSLLEPTVCRDPLQSTPDELQYKSADAYIPAETGGRVTMSMLSGTNQRAEICRYEWSYFRDFSFKHGKPFVNGVSFDDPIQGNFGDCYAIGAFSSIAKAIPEVIEKRIQYAYSTSKSDYYRVTFFEDGSYENDYKFIPKSYLVEIKKGDVDNPKVAHSKEANEVWPRVLEKGWAQFRKEMKYVHSKDFSKGGECSEVLKALLGEEVGGYEIPKYDSDGLFELLQRAEYNHIPVTFSTLNKMKAVDIGGGQVVGRHCYGFDHVEERRDSSGQLIGRFVHIYNPWGEKIEIPIEKFSEYFEKFALPSGNSINWIAETLQLEFQNEQLADSNKIEPSPKKAHTSKKTGKALVSMKSLRGPLFKDKINPGEIVWEKGERSLFPVVVSMIARAKEAVLERIIKDNNDGTYTVSLHGRHERVTVSNKFYVDSNGHPLYARSTSQTFWYPILKKAYAKLETGPTDKGYEIFYDDWASFGPPYLFNILLGGNSYEEGKIKPDTQFKIEEGYEYCIYKELSARDTPIFSDETDYYWVKRTYQKEGTAYAEIMGPSGRPIEIKVEDIPKKFNAYYRIKSE